MTKDDLKFLNSQAGEKMIAEFLALDENTRYKKLLKAAEDERPKIAAVLSLIASRQKAKNKFQKAEKMFFSSLNLEQSSSEQVSSHIAIRFKKTWSVADLTCGAGGNLLALAGVCKKVFAVELDEITLECAKLNASAHALEDKIDFFNKSAEEFLSSADSSNIQAVFLDPARDRENATKTRSILNSRPNLLEILPLIFQKTKNVGVKISPAFDWREIDLLPGDPEVEVISEDGVCKVAMLWFGDLKKGKRSAACFRKNGTFFFSDGQAPGALKLNSEAKALMGNKPLKFIFEADKAVSRAGLAEALAAELNLQKLDSKSQYFFGEEIAIPCGRVLLFKKILGSSLREVKKELKVQGVVKADISAKGHFLKPEEMYKKLKIKEGGEHVLILIPLPGDKQVFVLAQKLPMC